MPDRPYAHRRSFWADMAARPDEEDELVPGMPFHDHRPPRWLRSAIIGLTVGLAMSLVGNAFSLWIDIDQQQYVEGRGEYRDREARRIERESEERLRRGICDLLDQLPQGGLLDRPRAKYGCGPGIPIEELTPEEQERIGGRATAAVPSQRPVDPTPPTTPVPRPQAGGEGTASPTVPPPVEEPDPAPSPSPAPDPILDLGVVTDELCDTLLICA